MSKSSAFIGAAAFMSAYRRSSVTDKDPLVVNPFAAFRNTLIWAALFIALLIFGGLSIVSQPLGSPWSDLVAGLILAGLFVAPVAGLVFCVPIVRRFIPRWIVLALPFSGDLARHNVRVMLRSLRTIVVPALVPEGTPFSAIRVSGGVKANKNDHLTFLFAAAGLDLASAERALGQIRLRSGYQWARVTEQFDGTRAFLVFELRHDAPPSQLMNSRSYPLDQPTDSTAALLGWGEDGMAWIQSIFGKQTLIVGATGSGKGSVIWSIIAGIRKEIATGTVRLYGIDLKGGVEFAAGRQTFTRVAYTYDEAAELIAKLVAEVDQRLAYMRETGSRSHKPTPEQPGIVLMIDEAASLTYLAPDAKTAKAVDQGMKRILSTGRAAGISIIAAMQDPRKEALSSRDLFATQIALRLRTKDDAVLAIGQANYDAGAHCEELSSKAPGSAYVIDTETGGVRPVRAFWMDDAAVAALPAAPQDASEEALA